MKGNLVLIVSLLLFTACAPTEVSRSRNQAANPAAESNENNSANSGMGATIEDSEKSVATVQTKQPKTVRDFFNLLPQKYFTIEGCVDNPTRENCDKARAKYLNSFLEIEDIANGYMKGGCDGAQSCFSMALFKRPNGELTLWG
jgi:hypothetical protein